LETHLQPGIQKSKRGRPRKQRLESVAYKEQDEGIKNLKRTRLQQKSLSLNSTSFDPFSALNMMPSMTPKSPKKNHSDITSKDSKKDKNSKVVPIPLTLRGQSLKEKACHQ
jgi:hypothetical protein